MIKVNLWGYLCISCVLLSIVAVTGGLIIGHLTLAQYAGLALILWVVLFFCGGYDTTEEEIATAQAKAEAEGLVEEAKAQAKATVEKAKAEAEERAKQQQQSYEEAIDSYKKKEEELKAYSVEAKKLVGERKLEEAINLLNKVEAEYKN